MFNRKTVSFLTIMALLCIGMLPIAAENKAQQESFTTYVTNKYLASNFTSTAQSVSTETNTAEQNFFASNFMKKFNEQYELQQQTLTEREAQDAAFFIISPLFSHTTNHVIDTSVINKLELIGGGENASQHLCNIVFNDKLHTALGKAYTALSFCSPTTDTNILYNRQRAIMMLSQQPSNVQQKLKNIFVSLQKNEIKSLVYWHSKPVMQSNAMNSLYFSAFFDKLNTSTTALELSNKTSSIVLPAITASALPLEILLIAKIHGTSVYETIRGMIEPAIECIKSPEAPVAAKALCALCFGIVPSSHIFNCYVSFRNFKYTTEATCHLQDILIATSNHVNQLKQLSAFVNKNKQLIELLPTLKPLADFNDSKKHSAALNKLLGMLDTNTFKGEPSVFSITGRVLAAHKLMQQVKDELAPVFAAAGELEMYVALAQLYEEQQGQNATWCMANFVESDTPVIEAQGFWNPFINPEVVVVNDVIFNAQYPNSILTGPNTGGKSTVIKGVMLNVLMAQTFGMTPAQSFTLTPFAKLNCFMNIADDIATGASLFKSEVMRAKELSAMIKNLKEDEFCFVIIDEVFTGTSPVEGEQAALRFAQHLTTFPNSIAVIATHYPKMTTLEKETDGKFYNHHVEILRNEDGSLNRTFKLKSGPTFTNVAFDILEEEGLVI